MTTLSEVIYKAKRSNKWCKQCHELRILPNKYSSAL